MTTHAAQYATRLPSGHPEGFIEAFANIYVNVANVVLAMAGELDPGAGELPADFPWGQDGAHGVHFIHKAVESHRAGTWVDVGYTPPPLFGEGPA